MGARLSCPQNIWFDLSLCFLCTAVVFFSIVIQNGRWGRCGTKRKASPAQCKYIIAASQHTTHLKQHSPGAVHLRVVHLSIRAVHGLGVSVLSPCQSASQNSWNQNLWAGWLWRMLSTSKITSGRVRSEIPQFFSRGYAKRSVETTVVMGTKLTQMWT